MSGGEPADHRHHRGDLAPVMCGVVRQASGSRRASRVAELLTHVAGREILAERCRNFEETAVGPAVIVVEPRVISTLIEPPPTPARRRRRLPERSVPPGP